MATSFDRWEKDPYFPAAEEVQESADRMESTYRTWIHAKKDNSLSWDYEQLHRDLHTALGTTKWQLEEFARAVRSSYVNQLSDDARDRHREFIVAIDDQISRIENSLQEATLCQGKASMPWVSLDDGECDELALFLSGQSPSEEKISLKIHEKNSELPRQKDKESAVDHSKNSSNQVEWSSLEVSEGKCDGHRRTASASADIGAWKIAISDDGYLQNPTNGHCQQPPRKTPSFAGFLNSMEFATNLKWPKSNVRKWKAMDRQPEKDTTLLQPTQPTKQVINSCYEKSKSCLDCDDCYDKQLYGWYGAIQRQLQRSQYQMQYSRPLQVTIWILLFLCLIVLITLCAI
ncbi:uncharacterized protein LOC110818686 isoform X1 [Carica papaya]|uniref:uncharacterized protein LOC110818686 isoform X1 n=1 Tax=Carica papaya TaxID=3649 RepID=UPI000B8CEE43|nr:uncharacterized protein LOC110818686 isoform X1 [Carica papaya]